MLPMRTNKQTTSKDRATQLLICEKLSLAITNIRCAKTTSGGVRSQSANSHEQKISWCMLVTAEARKTCFFPCSTVFSRPSLTISQLTQSHLWPQFAISAVLHQTCHSPHVEINRDHQIFTSCRMCSNLFSCLSISIILGISRIIPMIYHGYQVY